VTNLSFKAMLAIPDIPFVPVKLPLLSPLTKIFGSFVVHGIGERDK
jgi:hypothetical protein